MREANDESEMNVSKSMITAPAAIDPIRAGAR